MLSCHHAALLIFRRQFSIFPCCYWVNWLMPILRIKNGRKARDTHCWLIEDWRVATPLGTQATNKPHTDLRSPGQGADSCLLTHSLSIEHSPHSYSKNSIRNIFKQTLFGNGKGFWGRSNARVELNIDLYRAFNFHPPCYDFYGFYTGFYGVFQVSERSHTRQSKLCKYLILSTMSTTTMCMSEIGCVA